MFLGSLVVRRFVVIILVVMALSVRDFVARALGGRVFRKGALTA